MISYQALCEAIDRENWSEILNIKAIQFANLNGSPEDRKIVAKIAEILTTPRLDIPPLSVRIVCLKCLTNSCFVFKYEKIGATLDDEMKVDDCHPLYEKLSTQLFHSKYFPYDGVIWWVENTLMHQVHLSSTETQFEILKLSIHFLCNLLWLNSDVHDFAFLDDDSTLLRIIDLMKTKNDSLCQAVSAYLKNIAKQPQKRYYQKIAKIVADTFEEAYMLGFNEIDSIFEIFYGSCLRLVQDYDDWKVNMRLGLLEFILKKAQEDAYSQENSTTDKFLDVESVQLLSEKFKKKSDLILKTVDSYLDGMEPREVILLLDIIGVISSNESPQQNCLQNNKSLLINCIFLLKALHMAGKQSKNYFTPVQKLSEVAPSAQGSKDESIQTHPAFGFKAGLIRAIGNLIHKHKTNQDLVRRTDSIALLMDCCNIDARNPLIMQWTILALRNVCMDNPENQEVIRNCNKIRPVQSKFLREMGIKLHEGEDGKTVGIVPLPREE